MGRLFYMLHSRRRLRKRVSSGVSGWSKRRAGVAVFQKAAVVEEGDVVAGVAGEAHLVGDDDEARAGFGEVAHDVEHFRGEFRIQGACGLVQQKKARAGGERTGDGDALLLAAGQLGWPLGQGVFQTEARE